MRVTDTETQAAADLIYGLDARPPLRETFLVALQHVFAVFVGIVTPPLLIAGALKLQGTEAAYLVSMSLFVSGAATILQTSRLGPVGSGLLSIQGTSFTFIAPIISVAGAAMAAGASADRALSVIFGLCMAGALVVMLFGSLQNLGLAGFVLIVILGLNSSRSPRVRMLSVVLGLAAGYAAALALGRLDLTAVRGASLFSLPWPFRFGLSFEASAFPPFLFMYLITVMESIGDLTATSSLTGQPISGPLYFRRLQGGLLADGVNSFVGACLNSFPSTTFAQNNGVIQLTGVASRYVGLFIGGILMLLGLVPAVGALVQALPPSALGGATLILFGMVAASGIRILSQVPMNRRNSVILATSLGLGLGVTFVPQISQALPLLLRNALSSGIATGGMCALLLNIVLPGERQ